MIFLGQVLDIETVERGLVRLLQSKTEAVHRLRFLFLNIGNSIL